MSGDPAGGVRLPLRGLLNEVPRPIGTEMGGGAPRVGGRIGWGDEDPRIGGGAVDPGIGRGGKGLFSSSYGALPSSSLGGRGGAPRGGGCAGMKGLTTGFLGGPLFV